LTPEALANLWPELTAKFPEKDEGGNDIIERTKGAITHKGYNTTGVKYAYVVERFNNILGPTHWCIVFRDYSASEIETGNNRVRYHVICTAVIELGNWIDGKWNPIAARTSSGGHTSNLPYDARKGAETNAIKKCASLYGVGDEAYKGVLDADSEPIDADEPYPGTKNRKPNKFGTSRPWKQECAELKVTHKITDAERDVMIARVEKFQDLKYPDKWTDNEWRLLRNLINHVMIPLRIAKGDVSLLEEMCEKQDLNTDKESA